MISPWVASRLTRMRAASTSSPSAISTIEASAPEVTSMQARQRRPFSVPGTGAALVVLHLCGKNRRREIGRHGGGGKRGSGGDGVALVRHGRRAAAAFARGLEGLGDVGLHHQLDVAGDLAAGPGNDGEHGGRVRDAVAMGVPGRLRQR